MIKKLSILLLLFSLMSLDASAQWFLFPGRRRQQAAQQQSAADSLSATRPDSTLLEFPGVPAEEIIIPDVFILDRPAVLHIGLVLPLQAAESRPSENFLDFYSGALLAIRDLGLDGLRADLQVHDSALGKETVPQSLVDGNDLIIGPVSFQDIQAALPLFTDGKVLVSPLEPRAAELAGTGLLVQSPSPWTAQIDDLVRWIREELPAGETLYLIRENTEAESGSQATYLVNQLLEYNVPYTRVSAVSEIPFNSSGNFRVLIGSDNDNFIASTVRSLGIEGAKGSHILLYGTSRVRTNGVAQTDLHNTEAHLTLSYFIDYDDPAVRRFVLAYRSLFQNEPGSFSFQGYDVMHYFLGIYAEYGRQWYKKLPAYGEKGLQSDFRFTEEGGRINQAVRRVVYHKDLSTELR